MKKQKFRNTKDMFLKSVSGGQVVKIDGKTENGFVKNRKNTYSVITTNSGFFSDAEIVSMILNENASGMNIKPVTSIDPESIQVEKTEMTQAEKAFMLARKYRYDDPTYTLKRIWQANKLKKMNDRDIKTVMEMVEQIKVQLQESS